MAERKVQVPGPTGDLVEGYEVPVSEALERWSDITLEDGTRMRVKVNVVAAIRIPDQFDAFGNPLYVINMSPTMAIVEAPPALRKKVQ
jgi:hypothetical protein